MGTNLPIVVNAKSGVDYLALGDSLAEGLTPYHKLDKGYPDYIAQSLNEGGFLQSFSKRYAVTGYTSADILNDIQRNAKRDLPGDPDKVGIRAHIQQAEIITLDLGANDILQAMDLYQLYLDPAKVPGLLNEIRTNTIRVLEEIRSLNPNARIYLMGYYNCLPHILKSNDPLLVVLGVVNENFKEITKQKGIDYVPTEDVLAKHSNSYFPNPFDIHPSLAGYQVIAGEFWKVIHFDLMDINNDGVLTIHDVIAHLKQGNAGLADLLKEYGEKKGGVT